MESLGLDLGGGLGIGVSVMQNRSLSKRNSTMDFHDTPEEALFRAEARAWDRFCPMRPSNLRSRAEESQFRYQGLQVKTLFCCKAWPKKKAESGVGSLALAEKICGGGRKTHDRARYRVKRKALTPWLSGAFRSVMGCAAHSDGPGSETRAGKLLPRFASGGRNLVASSFSEPAGGIRPCCGLRHTAVRSR